MVQNDLRIDPQIDPQIDLQTGPQMTLQMASRTLRSASLPMAVSNKALFTVLLTIAEL